MRDMSKKNLPNITERRPVPDLTNLAGGELVERLSELTQQKSDLRREYLIAVKTSSDAQVQAKILRVKIQQASDEIASCKFAITSERG